MWELAPTFIQRCLLDRRQCFFNRLCRISGFSRYLLLLLLLHTVCHFFGNRVLFFLRHRLHLRLGQTLFLEQLLADAFGRSFPRSAWECLTGRSASALGTQSVLGCIPTRSVGTIIRGGRLDRRQGFFH